MAVRPLARTPPAAGHLRTLVIFQLATTGARAGMAVIIGFAYLPRLQEPLALTHDCLDRGFTPTTHEGDSHARGNTNVDWTTGTTSSLQNGNEDDSREWDGVSEHGSEAEDEDDEEEEDRKRRARAYDLLAIYHRLRRLWPYLAPIQTRGMRIVLSEAQLIASTHQSPFH